MLVALGSISADQAKVTSYEILWTMVFMQIGIFVTYCSIFIGCCSTHAGLRVQIMIFIF